MNFLAHSLLAFDDTQLLAGQFCGDFVRGNDLSAFPAGVEKGIRLHRYLDTLTDSHELLRRHRRKITIIPQRFSGILVDVLFDHYLAIHWDEVCSVSLDAHADHVYESLQTHKHVLPDSLKQFMELLRLENILQNNEHLSAIELTLQRLSSRSSRFAPLALPKQQLKPVLHDLMPSFAAFYPELRHAAEHYLDRYSTVESSP